MSLLSVLFCILPVRRVRLLLLSAAALLLSAGVAHAQTVYGDYKVVGTGADAGISFEFLSTQPLLTPGLSTTFSFVNCTVPAGEICGDGTAQVGYSASGGQIRLSTTGANGQSRTWFFPSLLHTGVYIGQTGTGLEPGYVVVSGADATAGQPQSNAINSNFQFPIEVTVNNPTPSYQGSATVTFTAPGSGPSASFPDSGLAMTDISGRARLTPTANGIAGTYQITATAAVGANTFQTSFVAANVNTANAAGACQVTTANDDFSVGSLRYQIAACGKGGTITFASSINTVNLSVAQDIPLTQDLTIDGGGGVTINGNILSRIFFITGGTITLKNLTLENGLAAGGIGGVGSGGEGAGGGAAGMGGAIFVNAGSLAIANVTFTNNQAAGGSGGSALSGFFSGGGGGTGGPGGSSASVIAGNGGGGGDFGSSGGEGTDGPSNGPGDGAGGGQIGSGAFGGGGAGSGPAGGFGGGGGGGLSNPGASGTFGGSGGPNSPAGGGYGGAGLGGAIFMRNGTLSLTSATFSSNSASGGATQSGGGNGQGKGGALYISSTASAVSTTSLATLFSNNAATNAGAGTACNTVVGSNALDTNDICGILTGPATHFSLSAPPSVTSFIGYSVTVTALDANNNVVTGYTGTVHLTSTDPGFVNSTGDSTLTNGAGTFNVVMKQAGMQTITATDTADTFITATSNSILVNPGPPAFVMVSAPTATNGGATFPFTVTVTDLFGNLATSYNGTLHFTSSDATAVLPPNSVLTGGTGVFNATLATQGTQTLTATDTVTNTITGTSNGITVSIPGLVVTTTADSGPGSLRAALATAATDGSANITFDPTIFATPQTITLTSGTLNIPSNTTITGPTSGSGATLKNLVTVSGGGSSSNFSMFTVNSGVTSAAIQNLVIANGHVDSQGGGIASSGSLTVTGCTFTNNYAGGYITSLGNGGGAIYVNSGSLAVSDSTFVGNTSAPGGAIAVSSGIVAINQSTFSGNSAQAGKVGGAIFINTGVTMTIAGSTFSGNSAAAGGAVFNYSTQTATNTIMAGNTGGDCGAGGSGTCPTNGANGNVIGVSGISLAPLSNYSGPTQTMIPLPGSPAICAGSIAAIPVDVTTDQRGDARTTAYGGTTCTDAGAVQTNYSLSFSQQPTGGSANATITPSPAVQLDDNGSPIALSGAAISISPSSGTLNGTTTQSTDNNGEAAFGNLSIGTPQTNDTLTASVALTATGSPSPETASVTSAAFDITTLTPAITFTVPNHTYGDAAFPVAATSNSSGTITYSVVSGPATISANVVTLTGVGPVTLEASQAASGPYAAATQQATFNVVKATPSITWVPASSISYGTSLSALLNASASYNSNSVPGTFSYTAQATGGSTVPVTAVTVLAPGSYTLAASFTPTVTADYESASTSVHLLVGQAALTVAANHASKVYGTPNPAFTGTVTGAANNDSFTETFSTVATATSNAGAYAIVPSVTGTDLSDYTVTATNGTLTVTKAATATTLNASANSIASGQSLTLTAQVMDASAGSTGTPTGAVSFYDGTTLLGASTLTNSTASYTTATLAPGATHTLTATYTGDMNFITSTSNIGTIVVAAPPDFIFTGATPAAYTAAPGAVATYSFSLSPLSGGYPGPVGFTVTGLPASATATFTPSSVTANAGPTTVAMTVQTPSAVAQNSSNLLGRGIVLALLLLPFSVSRGIRKKLKGGKLLTVLLLVGITATMTGCGSDNGFLLQKAQTYTLTVTATSGTTQHSQTVTLIVQ